MVDFAGVDAEGSWSEETALRGLVGGFGPALSDLRSKEYGQSIARTRDCFHSTRLGRPFRRCGGRRTDGSSDESSDFGAGIFLVSELTGGLALQLEADKPAYLLLCFCAYRNLDLSPAF